MCAESCTTFWFTKYSSVSWQIPNRKRVVKIKLQRWTCQYFYFSISQIKFFNRQFLFCENTFKVQGDDHFSFKTLRNLKKKNFLKKFEFFLFLFLCLSFFFIFFLFLFFFLSPYFMVNSAVSSIVYTWIIKILL